MKTPITNRVTGKSYTTWTFLYHLICMFGQKNSGNQLVMTHFGASEVEKPLRVGLVLVRPRDEEWPQEKWYSSLNPFSIELILFV